MNREQPNDYGHGDGADITGGGGGAAERPVARAAPTSPFKLYKPGQGTWVRWGTAIGGGLIALAGAAFINERMYALPELARYLVPVAFLIAAVYGLWIVTGRKRGTVDFMVATESEMKKVNWSSRKEIIGSTKVVIFTVLGMSFMLFVVDMVFIVLFSSIGLLKGVNILARLFGSGPST